MYLFYLLPYANVKASKRKHINKHDGSNNELIICISAKLSFDK